MLFAVGEVYLPKPAIYWLFFGVLMIMAETAELFINAIIGCMSQRGSFTGSPRRLPTAPRYVVETA